MKHYKGFYNIVSNTSKNEATINIYGVIGGFDFETWKPINNANKFVEDFKKIESNADVIHVKINSPGGSVWDGLPIYNILKNSSKTIYTYVDGIAFSMASLIALSGDKVFGYANSMLMFHNGITGIWGNAKDLRDEADTLDKYDQALGSIIEEKLNISPEEVKEKYLNYSDNYFVGNEAQSIGFFDEIITSKNADVPKNIKEMSPQDILNHYSKLNFSQTKEDNSNKSTRTLMSKLNAPLLEGVIGSAFSEGKNETGVLLTDEDVLKIEAKLSSNQTALADAEKNAETVNNLNTEKTATTNAVQTALAEAEVENATEMSNVQGIEALAALVAEYGSNDGGSTTTPIATTEGEEENVNIVGGVDISAALNN
ncbi:head maturation protease, ClpP-related [Tenacibaculum mesophilum]|uniref:head maturation protease, ClpP-related n=1 Tax=Tenacibaculum mesophilum TaxID=104268 RepID=UPI00248F94AF|nr:head maturation protease, ClpP-related [Tenacibaculum mesophilum]